MSYYESYTRIPYPPVFLGCFVICDVVSRRTKSQIERLHVLSLIVVDRSPEVFS
jgi:hypothetical protein